MKNEYNVGTKVIMKKGHPCGTNLWEIIRVGVDIKLKCINCGRMIMMPRYEFNKKIKKNSGGLIWIEKRKNFKYIQFGFS